MSSENNTITETIESSYQEPKNEEEVDIENSLLGLCQNQIDLDGMQNSKMKDYSEL